MFLKRCFDFVVALISIVLLSPILIIIAILVRLKLGSPIFFLQERVGKNNRVFKIIKFRTMKDARDKEGNLLPDEKRMTSFGAIIRSLSIDELPELINILKGDMSIVGPRPLLVEYLSLYNEEQIKRHNVLPGLTGWAQINGRNNLTWNEKFELDVWYVNNCSFSLDLKIIFLTIYKVFKRADINKEGQVTTEYFNGMN